MESALSSFAQGTLDDLELLEAKAAKRYKSRNEKGNAEKVDNANRQRLKDLQRKRNELLRKLQSLNAVVSSVGNIINEEDDDINDDHTKSNLTMESVLELKKMKLEEILSAYRLTGISVPECNDKAQLLCFDSCYDGEFKSPQYVNLPTHGHAIQHHTLPAFIPLSNILENHNKFNSGHKSLVATISDYLSAFVKRREDALKVKDSYADCFESEMCISQSADYIMFTVSKDDSINYPIEVTLMYSDLRSLVPDKVKVHPLVSDSDDLTSNDDDLVHSWEEIFLSTTFLQAMHQILK